MNRLRYPLELDEAGISDKWTPKICESGEVGESARV